MPLDDVIDAPLVLHELPVRFCLDQGMSAEVTAGKGRSNNKSTGLTGEGLVCFVCGIGQVPHTDQSCTRWTQEQISQPGWGGDGM
jgi:hypothetical protein